MVIPLIQCNTANLKSSYAFSKGVIFDTTWAAWMWYSAIGVSSVWMLTLNTLLCYFYIGKNTQHINVAVAIWKCMETNHEGLSYTWTSIGWWRINRLLRSDALQKGSVPLWSSVRSLILGSVQVAASDATHRSRDSSSICASLQVINSTTMQRLAVADSPDKICLTNVLLWFIFL